MHFDAISCQISHYGAFNPPLITRIAGILTDFSGARQPFLRKSVGICWISVIRGELEGSRRENQQGMVRKFITGFKGESARPVDDVENLVDC